MPLPRGFDAKFFLQELDRTRDLCGAKVVYFDGAIMTTLREGPPISQADLLAVVVRRGGKDLIPASAEIAQARDQRFNAELLNLGMSCGGALLAWVAAVTSGAAAPVTGGTSLLLTHVATAAGWAGNIQCGVAVARMTAEVVRPQWTVDLDNTEWYPVVSSILDGIGLAGAAVAATGTLKMVLMLRKTSGKSMMTILRGLSRQERKRLTEEIIRLNRPGISNNGIQKLVALQKFPKRYSTTALNAGIRRQLMDAVGAGLNLTGSGTSGLVNQAVSGGQSSGDDYVVGVVHAYEVE